MRSQTTSMKSKPASRHEGSFHRSIAVLLALTGGLAVLGAWTSLAWRAAPITGAARHVEATGRGQTAHAPGEAAAQTSGADAKRALVAQVTAELDSMHGSFVRVLHGTPAWAEYEACTRAGHGDCRDAWATAVYLGLTLGVYTRENDELGNRLLSQAGIEALQLAVDAQLKSADPVQRIATLGLLNMNSHLKRVTLPYAAYTDLAKRSVVEAQLILERHVFDALPSDVVASEVQAMCNDPATDSRIWPTAVRTLGHPDYAAQLLDVTRVWLSPKGRDMLDPVMLLAALQRCGEPCAAGIEAMAADPRPEVRDHAATFVATARTK